MFGWFGRGDGGVEGAEEAHGECVAHVYVWGVRALVEPPPPPRPRRTCDRSKPYRLTQNCRTSNCEAARRRCGSRAAGGGRESSPGHSCAGARGAAAGEGRVWGCGRVTVEAGVRGAARVEAAAAAAPAGLVAPSARRDRAGAHVRRLAQAGRRRRRRRRRRGLAVGPEGGNGGGGGGGRDRSLRRGDARRAVRASPLCPREAAWAALASTRTRQRCGPPARASPASGGVPMARSVSIAHCAPHARAGGNGRPSRRRREESA